MIDDATADFRYTRAMALKDGVLIDVTPTTKKAWFKYTTALTEAVWNKYVAWPEGRKPAGPAGLEPQDESDRLGDILQMYQCARRDCRASPLLFSLHVWEDAGDPKLVTLKAVRGLDDDGRPCVTVMLPEEELPPALTHQQREATPMSQPEFLDRLAAELNLRRVAFDRRNLRVFVEACWPLIDGDEADVRHWAREFIDGGRCDADGVR
jgi:hypothetical protein